MSNAEILMTNAAGMTNGEILMTNQFPNDSMTKFRHSSFVIGHSFLFGIGSLASSILPR
jgi:hypothetical protein